MQNARGVAELFVCPRCLRQHYVSVIVALRERFYELDRTMNSHLRDAGTPAQRAAEAALQAFTKEREAENAYRHFQNKYQKRKEKGWRNMGPMRAEKHELKEALAAEQARRRRLHETTSPRRRRRALVNEQRQHRDDVVPHRRATPSARPSS